MICLLATVKELLRSSPAERSIVDIVATQRLELVVDAPSALSLPSHFHSPV
jgi:hypothetical protein